MRWLRNRDLAGVLPQRPPPYNGSCPHAEYVVYIDAEDWPVLVCKQCRQVEAYGHSQPYWAHPAVPKAMHDAARTAVAERIEAA